MTWWCGDETLAPAARTRDVHSPEGGRREGKDSMGIITWIVVGAIAGFIATLITGTREGIVMTIILGIVGALVGGFLAGVFLNVKDPTGINVETCLLYTSDAADE